MGQSHQSRRDFGAGGADAVERRSQRRLLALARGNGVTREEVVEWITHLAFYAGWPNNAITAVTVAREVFAGARR